MTYLTEPALLCFDEMGMGAVLAMTYFTEPAVPWLAGTVIGDVGANNIFHGRSITVVGLHGYGRGRGP